jgi:hypothetical protein
MEHLTTTETIYINSCNLLGVKLFKKYWTSGGSYWNETHMDKKNRHDLKRVIKDVTWYSKIHIGALVMETIALGIGSLSGYIEPMKALKYTPISLILHGYPLLVQKYNSILANAHLKNIPESKQVNNIEEDGITVKYLVLRKSYNYHTEEKSVHHYYISTKNQFEHVGPLFKNIERAKSFQTYIVDNYTEDEFNEHLYLNRCTEIYMEWKEKNSSLQLSYN